MRVTNSMPLGCSLLLPVGTVNSIQTRKGVLWSNDVVAALTIHPAANPGFCHRNTEGLGPSINALTMNSATPTLNSAFATLKGVHVYTTTTAVLCTIFPHRIRRRTLRNRCSRYVLEVADVSSSSSLLRVMVGGASHVVVGSTSVYLLICRGYHFNSNHKPNHNSNHKVSTSVHRLIYRRWRLPLSFEC
jgi:hypothetical protein